MITTRQMGGSFLFQDADIASVVVPEDLSAEQRQVASTAREFVAREVLPAIDALERHDWTVSRRLLRQAGDLGFGGVEIPSAFGGLDLDKVTATVVAQELGPSASFAVTFMVQTGIGSLPIVYFGTTDQKERYLPAIATGEKVAAYSLTETGSGSDALGAKTTARLSPDGTCYLLNGTKQWTSNAGFADVFVVFAKIDGDKFTAFLVDRTAPGVSVGAEERKMGLHGSSTAQVLLNDARVPIENLLHFPGRGHQVAFNMLNLGRFKLGAVCAGASRHLLDVSTGYARERRQFGQPIGDFPLIRQKLAAIAVQTYATEALVYRIAGLLDRQLKDLDLNGDVREQAGPLLAEYAIECSIAKVRASEALSAIADEAVQIHGGYGFMEGVAAERAYRDSRINRIFEGTNEINRLLIPQTFARRLRKGDYGGEVEEYRRANVVTENGRRAEVLGPEWAAVDAARAVFWGVLDAAAERFPHGLDAEQEIHAIAADVAIEVLTMESALVRAERAREAASEPQTALHADLARLYVANAIPLVVQSARRAAAYLFIGPAKSPLHLAIDALTSVDPVDTIATGRRIGAEIVAAEGWPLDR